MRTSLALKWQLFALAVLIASSLTPAYATRAVVNAQLSNDEIQDRKDLRAIFTLRKRFWGNGQPIKVYVLSDDSEVHQEFVRTKLHLFPYQLRHIWNRLVFSGTGVAPIEVDSEQAVLEAVAADPDAIGYVNAEELPEAVKELPPVVVPEVDQAVAQESVAEESGDE